MVTKIDIVVQAVHIHLSGPAGPELAVILQEIQTMSASVDELKLKVASLVTVEQSAAALLASLSQQIRDNAEDPAALHALANDIDAATTDLAAAVTANTQAADEPAPAPVDTGTGDAGGGDTTGSTDTGGGADTGSGDVGDVGGTTGTDTGAGDAGAGDSSGTADAGAGDTSGDVGDATSGDPGDGSTSDAGAEPSALDPTVDQPAGDTATDHQSDPPA